MTQAKGLRKRMLGNLLKSLSAECTSASYSMASCGDVGVRNQIVTSTACNRNILTEKGSNDQARDSTVVT